MDFFELCKKHARIDTYMQLDNPLEETIIRTKAYELAGADGVFVPGLTNTAQIQQFVENINIPLNIMFLPHCADINKMKKIGVKRFSFRSAMSDAVISHI